MRSLLHKYQLHKIRPVVFLPPFVLILVALCFSLFETEAFFATVSGANTWILDHFDWLFNYTSFFMVLLCAITFFSPLGKIKIGGAAAKPMLSKWRWFSIVLCTTIAVGILFWGAAEPLFHLKSPPKGLEPYADATAAFSMSTMFMHWTITPYAIYAVPALLFAIGYYNRKRQYSLGSILFPISNRRHAKWWGEPLNAICLFALVAGMAANLGVGLLSLAGGVGNLSALSTSPELLAVIAIFIVAAFTISASTGLMKGIRLLSDWNLRIFIALGVFVLVFGPTGAVFENLWDGLQAYVRNFIPHSLGTGTFSDEGWMHSWTSFYWANWMAWAPITALFLGRIAYGYTVRQFLIFNWLLPAAFSMLWMAIFSSTSLHYEMVEAAGMVKSLEASGTESVIYRLFDQLPGTKGLAVFFLITMVISFVTAADSNTEAMSGISSTGISPENPESPMLIKYVWGITVGIVAWVMVSFAGIDGIKMLSNLGGLPALLLLVLASIMLGYLLFKPKAAVPQDTKEPVEEN